MIKRTISVVSIVVLSLLLVQIWIVQAALSNGSAFSDRAADQTRAAMSSITLTEVIPGSAGLERPTDIANAGDGRLFINEKAGRIRVFDGTNLLQTPFLDISSVVEGGGSDNNESGLLGLVFHPQYAENGFFFVNYTHRRDDNTLITRVERYRVSSNDPNIADPNGVTIMEFEQDQGNHNGGDMSFGPLDGYLYISSGDGGRQGDPNNRAQTDAVLLGKILRIDVNGTGGSDCDISGESNYAIPVSNPLRDGQGGACDEIWSKGFRNPWRFSFDRGTADMWIADVGNLTWEEVNFEPASAPGGLNYGWRCYEGNEAFDTSLCGPQSDYVFPVDAYPHDGTPRRCSVTGGFVYRGTAVPALRGHYFFADYCSSEFWSFSGNDHQLTVFGMPQVPGSSFSRPTTFGEDKNGELYVAENGTGASIFRISGTDLPCETCQQALFIPLINK